MSPQPEIQEVPRLSPREVLQKMRGKSGRVLLVCAYDDEEKCRRFQLDGSITLAELEMRLSSLWPDDELVFYCA